MVGDAMRSSGGAWNLAAARDAPLTHTLNPTRARSQNSQESATSSYFPEPTEAAAVSEVGLQTIPPTE
jgi:hypothetical protein